VYNTYGYNLYEAWWLMICYARYNINWHIISKS
jgi:hypothetical protein